MRFLVIVIILAGTLVFLGSCSRKPPIDPSAMTPAQLAERGMKIYRVNCISCHNMDPKIDGAIGPAISGSSQELLTQRLLKNTYPDGYKPKRDTHNMPLFPYLEKDIPALAAYLTGS